MASGVPRVVPMRRPLPHAPHGGRVYPPAYPEAEGAGSRVIGASEALELVIQLSRIRGCRFPDTVPLRCWRRRRLDPLPEDIAAFDGSPVRVCAWRERSFVRHHRPLARPNDCPRGMRCHVPKRAAFRSPCVPAWLGRGASAPAALMGFSLRRLGPVRGWRDVSIAPGPPAVCLALTARCILTGDRLADPDAHPLAESDDQEQRKVRLLGFGPASKCVDHRPPFAGDLTTVLPWALPLSGMRPPGSALRMLGYGQGCATISFRISRFRALSAGVDRCTAFLTRGRWGYGMIPGVRAHTDSPCVLRSWCLECPRRHACGEAHPV